MIAKQLHITMDRLRKELARFMCVMRLRRVRLGSDGFAGVLVEVLVSFASLDAVLSASEADLILDLLRNAFPEVDHRWLAQQLKRAAREPQSLSVLASELKDQLDDDGKLSVGMQLFTLVNAAGRSEQMRTSFEIFMRKLGRPDYGEAILQEMLDEKREGLESVALPFEKLVFEAMQDADVVLPPAAAGHAFRVYRIGDLVLLRNTGKVALWVRGRSLASGGFLRMGERQVLAVPGWALSYADLIFFLNNHKTGNAPVIYVQLDTNEIKALPSKVKQSELKIEFGLKPKLTALKDMSVECGNYKSLKKDQEIICVHHERLRSENGLVFSIEELRNMAMKTESRFRLNHERRKYRVTNDASIYASGDLLLGLNLAPRVVLDIRYDSEREEGVMSVVQSEGAIHVDGILVKQDSILLDGSLIRLSASQAVRCRFRDGFLDEERMQIETLEARDLIYDFKDGTRALDHLNFKLKRGELVCVMGPSGCGKSTLMSVLSGQKEPTNGSVLLNGYSLYDHADRLVPFIAHMPHEEALLPHLTVRENLRTALLMRRPNLSFTDQERRVDSVLAELGLLSIAQSKVGFAGEKSISSGERGRLNLASELGGRSEVFLFDEPISGLSSKDSEHLIETLRVLAKEKIVLASIHRPGAQVLRMFDQVMLLDRGGKLAYFGTPAEMLAYFRNVCQEYGIENPAMLNQAPLDADFVFDVMEMPLLELGAMQDKQMVRRFPPSFWQERFESETLVSALHHTESDAPEVEHTTLPQLPIRKIKAYMVMGYSHFMRSFLSKIRNRGTLYSTFLEAPVLAALISITLRSSPKGSYQFFDALHLPAYLFLSVTVAMFLGLTNGATEILRDRPILRRERNFRMGSSSYVWAKFLSLSLISALQCITYLMVGNFFLEIEGMLFNQWWMMVLTALTGTALALLISSLVRSERSALTAVPLLLVPQMLLAGALVPYKEMNRALFNNAKISKERGGVPVPTYILPLRYAYEGILVGQATRNPFERERLILQQKIDQFRRLEETNQQTGNVNELMRVKEGLRSLLAAGAESSEEAHRRIKLIMKLSMQGKLEEFDTLMIWPEGNHLARPASEFFVNERVDLLVREAETFRNDYRNASQRDVFLALKKPLPWANFDDERNASDSASKGSLQELKEHEFMETQHYCSLVLVMMIVSCGVMTTRVLNFQQRKRR